eukprot:CAMPEP_0116985676 /NCGR_PEP_ID=MMETSP0467-20121206/62397_1 /TAXON_ID=283647 /ORGANISM="Mesodinium pulex, Strain SPMC105" /LENGTH=45 /DNA_ID= /DNA_START= /DNA_END= /DNA_ORIENTATION=
MVGLGLDPKKNAMSNEDAQLMHEGIFKTIDYRSENLFNSFWSNGD